MFFQSDSGREPVREWLKELPPEERKIIGEDIKTVQWGWPIGMPLVRSLGDGLFEVRSSLKNRIARVLFMTHEAQIVLLHGFVKKTQKMPDEDLKLAKKRKAKFDEKA
jgi:phage-related protein